MGTIAEDPTMRSDLRAHVETRAERQPSLIRRRRRLRTVLAGSVVAVAGPAAVTAIAPWLDDVTKGEPLEPAGLLYVLAVAAATYVGTLWAGLAAALLSMLGQLLAYVPPRGDIVVVSTRDLIVLSVFLVVALGFAQVLSRQRSAREDAQVARERTAFLAEAAEILTRASLDFQRTMSELAQLTIPAIADLCIVHVLEGDGLIHPIVVANSDKVDGALADNLLHLEPVAPSRRGGVPGVFATGEPELFPVVDDRVLEEIAWNGQHLVLLRGLRLRSKIVVALKTRAGVMATVTFAFVGGGRRYAPDDLRLAQALAGRAGSVLENVLLYEQRSRTARTLQASLLPAEVPEIPGLEVVTRFHPVGEADLVGGDFYDVFEIAPGTWAIVLGDVCGKGVEAAALTGLARHTIRAAALQRSRPSQVLAMLNDAILRARTDRYCTVLFALLRAGDPFELTVAAGGHPLPVLRRDDGTTTLVGATGTLLGMFADPVLIDATVGLGPGDAMVFYTDGLLNERLPDPERHLCEVVRTGPADAADGMADRVERVVLPAAGQNDDAALVVIRVADGGAAVNRKEASAWSSS